MGIETVLIGAAIAGTGASIYSSEKARSQQRKAERKQNNMRKLQSARDAMGQVRQARIAQAQIIQGAATAGTDTSSAAQGGYAAVGSSAAGNIQFINQIDSIQSQIARNMEKANQYAGNASTFNALSNLALMGASMAPNKTASTPTASSGSGYTVQGGYSGKNFSAVASSNPLMQGPPAGPFG